MDDVELRSTSIWRGADAGADPFADVRRLGLERHVAEIDSQGFTVIPPEATAAPPGFAEELREAILEVGARRRGVTPDFATGESHRDLPSGAGQHLFNLLLEGEVFERAVTNEAALAMITYLVGESCQLSSMTAMIKGPGKVKLDLHSDVLLMPPPYPSWASGANATWALTNYYPEAGPICFWPGSHRFCRHPTPAEMEDTSALVPVEARAGSLIVWHSNTWHGALPRTAPGLRVNLIMFFSRPFMFRQEEYRSRLGPEVFARNGPRFASLVGADFPFPMGATGPDYGELGRLTAAARTQAG